MTGLIEVIYSWYKIVLGKTFPRYGRIQSWLAAIVLFYFFPQLPCLGWMDWHQVIINRYERSPSCSFLCNFVGNSELKKDEFAFQENCHKWNVISMFSVSMNTNNRNFNISRRLSATHASWVFDTRVCLSEPCFLRHNTKLKCGSPMCGLLVEPKSRPYGTLLWLDCNLWKMSKIHEKLPFFATILPWMASYASKRSF